MVYSAPDVYIEDVKPQSQSISQADSSVGAMIGVANSGELNKPTLITSWTDFINKFANGLDSPFLATGYLPYAVYGFFVNGGSKLYVTRVAHETAKKAKKVGTNLTVEASTEGAWGNALKVDIKKSSDWVTGTNEEFDVTITLNSNTVKIAGVFKDTIVDAILNDSTAKAWFGDVTLAEVESLTEETIELADGEDGVSDLVDSDYVTALSLFDSVADEITMVSIPGVTTPTVRDGVLAYCDNNKLFPVITAPKGSTRDEVKTLRKATSATYGAMIYPWGNLVDPLTNKDKLVPPEGAYMGVASRIIQSRGVGKAPAGTEAVLRGFTSMEFNLTKADCAELNPVGVICLLTRRNYGLVVWGVRGLNSADSKMRYVSDHFLNINIRKSLYEGTQFAVFEPNNESLWIGVKSQCKAFLENLRQQGALKGEGEGDAYYVICDSTNNTQDTIDAGYLYIDVGYAPVKPTEFVVVRLAHSMESAS